MRFLERTLLWAFDMSAGDDMLEVMIFLYHRIAEICFPWIMCQQTNANDPLWVVLLTMRGRLGEVVVSTWILENHQLC